MPTDQNPKRPDSIEETQTSVSNTEPGAIQETVRDSAAVVFKHISPESIEAIHAPRLQLPPIDTVVTGIKVPGWLQNALNELSISPWQFKNVAGLGLATRMGATFAENKREFAQKVLEGEKTPSDRVRTWAEGLNAEELAYLQGTVDDQIVQLLESLEVLPSIMSEGGETAKFMVQDICKRRDALESVAVVLELAGRNEAREDLSNAVDSEAATLLSSLDLVDQEPNDVLLHTAVEIPGAWWAPAL